MAGKRLAGPVTPTKDKGGTPTTPKKAKTPPEKGEQQMTLATGATYEVRLVRCVTGANLYKVTNEYSRRLF